MEDYFGGYIGFVVRSFLPLNLKGVVGTWLTDRLKKLSELVEDIVRTTIDTGPRGAIRFAQGIEAVVTVGGEWAVEQLRVIFLFGS